MLAAVASLVLYTWALLPETGLVTQEMAPTGLCSVTES